MRVISRRCRAAFPPPTASGLSHPPQPSQQWGSAVIPISCWQQGKAGQDVTWAKINPFRSTPPFSSPYCTHSQHMPWAGKGSFSSPLATAAQGFCSPTGACISISHGLSLVLTWENEILFFFPGYLWTFSCPKVAFSAWRKAVRCFFCMVICMHNLNKRGKILWEKTFTWKELLCSALICVVWLTLSGDKPGALLLYFWGQEAKVISILEW